jgi:hypothetical protein
MSAVAECGSPEGVGSRKNNGLIFPAKFRLHSDFYSLTTYKKPLHFYFLDCALDFVSLHFTIYAYPFLFPSLIAIVAQHQTSNFTLRR